MSPELVRVLCELHRRDVRLWVEDRDIVYDALTGALTERDLDFLRAHKPELLEAVRSGLWAAIVALDLGEGTPTPRRPRNARPGPSSRKLSAAGEAR
jgi:hypothetical protein